MVTLDIFVPLPVEPTEAPLDLRPVLPLLKVRCKEPVSPESDSRFLYGKSIGRGFRSGISIHHVNCSFTTSWLLRSFNSICDSAINILTMPVRAFCVLLLCPCIVWIFTYSMNLTHFSSCKWLIPRCFPLHCHWAGNQCLLKENNKYQNITLVHMHAITITSFFSLLLWKSNLTSYKVVQDYKCVALENIHAFPMDGFLVWFSPPHPSGDSSVASYMHFPLKILTSETPTPLEFPMAIHVVGMHISWNLTQIKIMQANTSGA